MPWTLWPLVQRLFLSASPQFVGLFRIQNTHIQCNTNNCRSENYTNKNKNISNIGTIALLMLEVRMLMNRTLELQGWFLGAALSGPLVGFRRRHEDLGRTCTWHCLSWPNVKLFQISAFRCFACARSPDVTFLFRQPFPFGRDAGVCAGQGRKGLRRVKGWIARLQSADAVQCLFRSRECLLMHPDAAGQATCTSDDLIDWLMSRLGHFS